MQPKRPKRRKSLTSNRVARRAAVIAAKGALKPAENRYADALTDMARAWAKAYERELTPLVNERKDAIQPQLPSSFAFLGIRVQAAIERNVGGLFDRMSKDVVQANGKLQEAHGIPPKMAGLGKFIAERRSANLDLVKEAHADYANSLRELFTDPANYGMRSETLAKRMVERGAVSESRAELIARDQTLTLNGQITKERQTSAGVERYTWSTSLDERVRPDHAALEGQVFDWDNPPAVGHPGDDILCRCVAVPIIEELESVFEEPAKAAEPDREEPAQPDPGPNTLVQVQDPERDKDTVPIPANPQAVTFENGLSEETVKAFGAKTSGDWQRVSKEILGDKTPTADGWRALLDPGSGLAVHLDTFEARPHSNTFAVSGVFRDAQGNYAGVISYSFERDAQNNLIVHHNLIKLEPDFQGMGVGERVARNSIRGFQQMGATEVRLEAAWTGRYTWAKFGWDWPASEGAKLQPKLEKFLAKRVGKRRAKTLAGSAVKSGASGVAQLEVDGKKLGKDFLLSDDVDIYDATLKLKDGDRGFEVAKQRLKL